MLTLLLATTLLLVGCSRGPGEDQLQRDLQMRIDQALGRGLLQIHNFRRYGSQPLSSGAVDGRQRVAIYFKAEMELLRSHRFSDWSGQSISALHQALGSAAKGVEGVEATGNKAGDMLIAHGLSVYADEDKDWLAVSFQSETGAGKQHTKKAGVVAEIDAENSAGQDPQTIWLNDITGQLQQLTSNLARKKNAADSATLRSELQSVLTRARLKELKAASQPVLLSGAPAGNYHALAQGVENILQSSQGEKINVLSSSGAIENIALLHDELATFALTQSDLAAASFHGSGVFAGQQSNHLRALAALYPEPVQIVVRGDSGINTLADLQEKRVNIGAHGTGTQANAKQILSLAKLDYSEFTSMDVATAVNELMGGRLDALFVTGALPSRYLRGVDEQVKLLPLDAVLISQLVERHGYVSHQIKPQTYPGVNQEIATVAVTAVLVADERASNAQVTALLKGLFDASTQLSEFSERASSLDPNRALDGIVIPLHNAASEFFKQRGGSAPGPKIDS